jgi:hypothetical protein
LLVDLVVGASLLVLHVLGDEVLQVGLCLGLKSSAYVQKVTTHEFQLVHTLSSVPMDESLSPVHGRELLADSLEQRLDRSRVADEGGRHFEASGWDVALSGRDVSWDPLDEVTRVFGL